MTVYIFYNYSDSSIDYIASIKEVADNYANKTGKNYVTMETDEPIPAMGWYSVNYYTYSQKYASLMYYPPIEEDEYINICIYDQPGSDGRIFYEMHGCVRAEGCKEAKTLMEPYMEAIENGTFLQKYPDTLIGEKTHRKYYRIEL